MKKSNFYLILIDINSHELKSRFQTQFFFPFWDRIDPKLLLLFRKSLVVDTAESDDLRRSASFVFVELLFVELKND